MPLLISIIAIPKLNVKLVNYIFTLLIGATVSLSIRVMGILVVSSIIVVPVATAMQLKKGFTKTLIFAILFGFLDVMIGLVLSYYINSAPGGTIALTSVIFLLLTLTFTRFFNYEN